MRLTHIVANLALLAGFVKAGSRLWEVNPTTITPDAESFDKRAISIKPSDSNAGVRRWPDKTITYAYVDKEAEQKLSVILQGAMTIWQDLDQHGFLYDKIEMKACKRRRTECLVIHYNDQGRLRTTVGIQVVEKGNPYVGPTMHLSDREDVGNLNANINAAHELGHAWGLYHEHQNDKLWGLSDLTNNPAPYLLTGDTFATEDYHCDNLKGYEDAHAKMQTAREEGKETAPLTSLCYYSSVAQRYDFDAVDWMPQDSGEMSWDGTFDPDSLMLYPSGAGGKGDAAPGRDNRLPILTYPDGKRIPLRRGPSTGDTKKLIELYGSQYVPDTELLNDKSSTMKNRFNKLRNALSRKGGDTKDGVC
ncbi:zinc-dependent metalloprotease [Fusarium heterosporum]|uniref:Zinc-dependent metalloprotease n=1 Tax=Fusarium heterosporum TaxID=42747 RepID=A0A8H5X124_FUSHE|nr:zinc-dependent metalloprotease [Fusarium heterosporum]